MQWRASGSMPSGTVTIAVILTQPQTKGDKVIFLAIDAVGVFDHHSFIIFNHSGRIFLLISLSQPPLGSLSSLMIVSWQSC